VWRLSVPDTTPPLDLPGDLLIDWGGALRWYATSDDSDTNARNADHLATSAGNTEQRPPRTREAAIAAGGTALCWRGPAPSSGRFHPLQPTAATLNRRLKAQFDPHGIFNPGRLIVGL
jgi:glycolate oxidase FAD binding subunit